MKAAVYCRYGSPDAYRHVDAGRKKGNVVVTITGEPLQAGFSSLTSWLFRIFVMITRGWPAG